MFKRIFRRLAVFLLVIAISIGLWLYFVPPNLLRVGSGYAAKIVCSNVFIANRNADEVLAQDVQAPGHPLLRLMRIAVDREEKHVTAALLGFIAPSEAVYREGMGCAIVPAGMVLTAVNATKPAVASSTEVLWPEGEKTESDESLVSLLSDAALIGPGMRAVVIVKDGNVAAEVYGEGFSEDTPLLGWSMTKTVNAAIIGRLIMANRISVNEKGLFPQWQNDGRADIRIADLLAMESGLAFNENYGTVADVTRMLFLEPDMAHFVAGAPLEAVIGSHFSYSSGTSVLLSRIWMDRIGNGVDALDYPQRALFDPLGMTSAVMETDAAGTFVGSSYMYATARDWARFGLFLAHDGVWQGERLLPEGFVREMHTPNGSSDGRYSKIQTWLPKSEANLPSDAFVISGHDGQTIFVIPSLDLVIVRLGLTPRSQGYDASILASEVVKRVNAD